MIKITAMMIAATAIMSTSAAADPLTPGNMNDDEWRFSIGTYAFIPVSTTGSATIADSEVDLDFDLSDVLDFLNFAIAGRGEAWKGDFGVILDASYVNLDLGGDIDLPIRRIACLRSARAERVHCAMTRHTNLSVRLG